jgi:prolyl oligopeptidase
MKNAIAKTLLACEKSKLLIPWICPLMLICAALLMPAQLRAQTAVTPPATPKKPVVDEYHGIKVTDDYRWLENWDDPAVRAWSDAQNQYTRAYLDNLAVREPIKKWLRETANATSVSYFSIRSRGDSFFAMKTQPPKNQPFLISLKSLNDPASERVILDPNQLNAKGTTAIDFYVPSLDGRYVAVSLSEGGSEEGTVHVYDVGNGKETGDVIPRVNKGTGGGSVAWIGDGTGFFYTRYPADGERPKEDADYYQQIYFHKLGTPVSSDSYSAGKDFPRIAEIFMRTSEDGQHVLAQVANGDGGEFAYYVMDLKPGKLGAWAQVAQFSDQITQGALGKDQALYLLSTKNAPRGKVLRLPLEKPSLDSAETVVPQSDAAISAIVPAATLLYVIDSVGGPSRIRIFDQKGHAKGEIPTLPISAVYGASSPRGDDLLYDNESHLTPGAWYRYDKATGKTTRTALVQTSPVDFSDVEVVRELAVSKDGTKIPMSVLRRKGAKLDATAPALLTGYGGYNISLAPNFDPTLRIFLDRGGVWAVANLRGGGEYGEEWHHAGNLTRKQNVFDDFSACAQHLVDAGYTKPVNMAIIGGSNGGLLMGASLVQHPEMYRAVVSFVGIYDMLRIEAITSNAVFNIPEFGTVKDAEQFKALYAYSPYQHVTDGTAYPAVLFLTGANDPRVNPANSRKMTARLQAATNSKRPVLLRTSSATGHGIDSSLDEQVEEGADVWAFLFDQLGLRMDAAKTK